jgi:hypothetical protein
MPPALCTEETNASCSGEAAFSACGPASSDRRGSGDGLVQNHRAEPRQRKARVGGGRTPSHESIPAYGTTFAGTGAYSETPRRFSSTRSGCRIEGNARCSQSLRSQRRHVTPTGVARCAFSRSIPSE